MEAVTETNSLSSQNTTQKRTSVVDLAGLLEKDFQTVLKSALGGEQKSQVNEEEVFSALVEQQLAAVSDEAQESFRAEKQKLMVSMARADGYVNVEDVTNSALHAVSAGGAVDAETAASIKAIAFRCAQLDDNLNALYDSRGSAGDPTIAVDALQSAVEKANLVLEQYASGELSVDATEASSELVGGSGVAADGSGGFLWKPESERDGNLALLLPTDLAGTISKVEVHSLVPPSDATKLAEGNYSGDTNGDRPTYRFDKPGSEFGQDVYVVVYKDDGTYITYEIPDGSERVD